MADIFDLFKQISKPQTPAGNISFLLVGLGNPGPEYTFTRHNSGFLAIDYISQKLGFKVDRSRFKALCGEVVIAGRRGLVMKPQTYMNASGEAVREAADFYKISSENIYVICDDISLAPGRVRLRTKGSDGGQKGLRSIIYQLGSDDFPRIRVGVGEKPRPDYDLADWVLGTFPESDKTAVFEALGRICDTLPTLIGGDTDKAMNILNTAAK